MGIILFSFSLFIYIFFKPRNYTLNYEINGYKVTEEYNLKYKLYYFKIENEVYTYDFVKEYKYNISRKLISKIDIDDNCVKVYIENEDLTLCAFSDENNYYQELLTNNTNEKITTKNNIDVYNYFNNTYIVWNYQGIDVLSENDYKNIKLFNTDIYNNNLMGLVNNFLVFPNYEDDYEYQELIALNIKTGKKTIIKLADEIASDSYISGVYKNSVFIIDRKNKKEYEVNLFWKKVREIGNENKDGKIYYLNAFKEVGIDEIIDNNLYFEYDTPYQYEIKDSILYLSYLDHSILTKVDDFTNGHIIKIIDDTIYYLIDDTLYLYSPSLGRVKLLQNFEWNFNFENKIFIINNI